MYNNNVEVEKVSEDVFSEALTIGYVECRSVILLLIGVAGAGKSSFKRVLFNHEKKSLQIERNSTPLAEAAIRAVSTSKVAALDADKDNIIWKEFTADSLQELLAGYSILSKLKKISGPANIIDTHVTPSQSPNARQQSADVNSTQIESTSELSLSTDELENTQKQTVPVQTESTVADRHSLLNKLHKNEVVIKFFDGMRQVEVFRLKDKQTWIYVIDSGGQPQFQELLPLFVKNASAVAFFVKLNELLDQRPSVEYFSLDKAQGKPYEYSLTHKEVLENSFHTIQSRKDTSIGKDASVHQDFRVGQYVSIGQDSSDATFGQDSRVACDTSVVQKCPKLFLVGTFRDKIHEREDIKSKNESLRALINHTECCRKNVIYHHGNDPLFCVNAKNPNEEDFKVASVFRRSVTEQFESSELFKVPIQWFLFEQLLQKKAQDEKRCIFSIDECKDVAKMIEMDEKNLYVALSFFDSHKVLSWSKNILHDVVFTSAQVFLDKLSELVERSYVLCNNAPEVARSCDFMYGMEGTWQDFQHYGCITIEVLKQFPKHYSKIFTAKHFLDILVELLVVAKDSRDSYFMPCILCTLPKERLGEYRTEETLIESNAPPLLVFFEKQFFPTGIFSCLIAYLRNKAEWKILKKNNLPKCFYKNCVQFIHETIRVTLIYSARFVEVHPVWKLPQSQDERKKDCQVILTVLQQGLCEAAKVQSYDHLCPNFGIFCPEKHGDGPHVAIMHPGGKNYWECVIENERIGNLTEQSLWWSTSKLTDAQ